MAQRPYPSTYPPAAPSKTSPSRAFLTLHSHTRVNVSFAIAVACAHRSQSFHLTAILLDKVSIKDLGVSIFKEEVAFFWARHVPSRFLAAVTMAVSETPAAVARRGALSASAHCTVVELELGRKSRIMQQRDGSEGRRVTNR